MKRNLKLKGLTMDERLNFIISKAVPIQLPDRICGVYLLFNEEEIVYIGMSVDVVTRILSHKRENRKVFNTVKVIHCDKQDLETTEKVLIECLLPLYNIDKGAKKIKSLIQRREEHINALFKKLSL